MTGAASGVGLALARRLVSRAGRTGEPGHSELSVVALDATRGDLDGVTWRIVELTDPGLVRRLEGCHVLVHPLASMDPDLDPQRRRDLLVRGTQTVLTSAAAAGVARVVLTTSAMVYGALPDNPVPLPEDAPLRAVPDGGLLGDLLEIERLAARAPLAHPGLQVTVLRPAALVGPGVDTVLTRHFEAPRLLVVRDARPCWQFCHVEDLASALELAALEQVTGVLAVGSPGWLEQEEVERISGMRRVELPAALAFGTAERLHRLGLIPAPASDLQYVVHPWVVRCDRLEQLSWQASFDNATALGVLLDEVEGRHALAARRLGRRDAAGLGAAGAAVAVVGTAALVRRARRQRRAGG